MKKYLIKISLFIFLIMSYIPIAQAVGPMKSSLVTDIDSGKILHESNAHAPRYPASLVKMMTIYLAFQQITEGKLTINQNLKVSNRAAAMPRTNLGLKAGSYIPVHKAILGLIVHSGNDTAVVLAEAIGGSEENFAIMMNRQAKRIGMHNTIFRNASGWHNKEQKSTAHDLAKLAIALKKDFPKFFPWFSITSFSFNNKTYVSHNHVVRNYQWATGLKTGFTNPSGFNVVTTANKHGKELIGVVLGEPTSKSRDKFMTALLNHHFHKKSNDATVQMAQLADYKEKPKVKTVTNKKKNSKKPKK